MNRQMEIPRRIGSVVKLPPINELDATLRDDPQAQRLKSCLEVLEAGHALADKSRRRPGDAAREAAIFIQALSAAEAVLCKVWKLENKA